MADPAPATPANPAPADPALNNPAPAAADPAPAPAPAASPEPAASPAGDPPPAAGDDWREKYAAGDEKKLKRLQRYGSMTAALDALFNAQAKIAQGIKEPLKADAPPEELARWREDNGIPQTAEGYAMPDGVVIGENDKPVVDEFLKMAHDRNWQPDDVKAAIGWFTERQAAQADAQSAHDAEIRMANEEVLREEYGPKYMVEVKRGVDFLRGAIGDTADQLIGGRLADGTPVGNSPEMIRWLNSLARELQPISTVVPGAGTNAMQAVEAEMASLKKMMGDRSSDYWKGPTAAKNQARYRELVEATQKHARRAA